MKKQNAKFIDACLRLNMDLHNALFVAREMATEFKTHSRNYSGYFEVMEEHHRRLEKSFKRYQRDVLGLEQYSLEYLKKTIQPGRRTPTRPPGKP